MGGRIFCACGTARAANRAYQPVKVRSLDSEWDAALCRSGESAAMDRQGQRAEYAAGLRVEAARRFGSERAAARGPAIEDVAAWMVDLATFPLDADEPPAFYNEPAS